MTLFVILILSHNSKGVDMVFDKQFILLKEFFDNKKDTRVL